MNLHVTYTLTYLIYCLPKYHLKEIESNHTYIENYFELNIAESLFRKVVLFIKV